MRNTLIPLDAVRARFASLPIRSLVRSTIHSAPSARIWWTKSSVRTALSALLVASAYYVGALVGFLVQFRSSPISPIWPPNTILLVALLLMPMRRWWVCLLAVMGAHMLVELPSGVPFATASGLYVTNVGEAVIGALAVRHLAGRPPWLDNLRKVTIYLVCAVLVAPVVTSFADAAVILLTRWGTPSDYWQLWTTRCVSNVMAQLTIGPALLLSLTVTPTWMRDATRWRQVEAALLATGLLVVGIMVFDGRIQWEPASPVLLFALLPFLLWAAIRFGIGGTSVSLLGVTILATWGAIRVRGPFSTFSPADDVISLQLFLIGISAPMVFLAALVEERKGAMVALRGSEERYRMVVRSLPHSAVLLFDEALRHTVADGPGLAVLGLAPKDLEGRTMWEVFPDELARTLAPHYEAALAGLAAEVDVEHGRHIHHIQVTPMPMAMLAASGSLAAPPAPRGMVVLQDVTEQRRARDELERERTRAALLGALSQEFRTLADHSPDLIARVDPLGHILYVNSAVADLLGRPSDHWIGKSIAEVGMPRRATARWAQWLRDIVEARAPRTVDVDFPLAPGSAPHALHVRLVPEVDRETEDGEIVSVLIIATDVTALKRAQARVAEQASELEAIFEATADGLGVFDCQRRLVRANPAWQAIHQQYADATGRSADPTFTALPLADQVNQLVLHDEHDHVIPREQRPTSRALRGETITGANAVDEWVHSPAGQAVVVFSVSAAPVRDESEKIAGAVTMVRDVTARRQLERQVVEQAAQLAAIFDSIADGVLVVDRDGRVVRANRAWQEMFHGFGALAGLSRDPDFPALPLAEQVERWIQWQRLHQYLPKDPNGQAIPHEATPTYRALRGETVTGAGAVDERVQAPDGRVFEASVSAAPIRDVGGNIVGAVTVAHDVTAHRQLEHRLQAHIAQAATEAERGRIARELHDTVTQELYSASLLAETLIRDWEPHPVEAKRAVGLLHEIVRGGLSTMRLLLLELRSDGLEELALPTLLRRLLAAMRTRAGVPLSLDVTGDDDTWQALPQEVKQAFYRMAQEAVTNAVKYASANHIAVRLRRGRRGTLHMEIADNGIGFDPHIRTPGHFGLTMMRERAQAIGAVAHVRSQLRQGTRVVIHWRDSGKKLDETSAVAVQQQSEQEKGAPDERAH